MEDLTRHNPLSRTLAILLTISLFIGGVPGIASAQETNTTDESEPTSESGSGSSQNATSENHTAADSDGSTNDTESSDPSASETSTNGTNQTAVSGDVPDEGEPKPADDGNATVEPKSDNSTQIDNGTWVLKNFIPSNNTESDNSTQIDNGTWVLKNFIPSNNTEGNETENVTAAEWSNETLEPTAVAEGNITNGTATTTSTSSTEAEPVCTTYDETMDMTIVQDPPDCPAILQECESDEDPDCNDPILDCEGDDCEVPDPCADNDVCVDDPCGDGTQDCLDPCQHPLLEGCDPPDPCGDGTTDCLDPCQHPLLEGCDPPDPCENPEDCQVPDPCENPEDCEIPNPCENPDDCQVPDPCENPENCEIPDPCGDGTTDCLNPCNDIDCDPPIPPLCTPSTSDPEQCVFGVMLDEYKDCWALGAVCDLSGIFLDAGVSLGDEPASATKCSTSGRICVIAFAVVDITCGKKYNTKFCHGTAAPGGSAFAPGSASLSSGSLEWSGKGCGSNKNNVCGKTLPAAGRCEFGFEDSGCTDGEAIDVGTDSCFFCKKARYYVLTSSEATAKIHTIPVETVTTTHVNDEYCIQDPSGDGSGKSC